MPNIIDYIFADKKSDILSFSLCFSDNGGNMGIGGMNYNKHLRNTPIFTVPLIKDVNELRQYNVKIQGIKVQK